MKTILLKSPVFSFRKIESLYDEAGKSVYMAVLNIKDLPEELEDWRGLNPRDPKLQSGVSKKIAESLNSDPEAFFFKNRGLTIMAEQVTWDNKTGIMQMEMSDQSKHGLLDGGHTFRIILEAIANMSEEKLQEFNAFVRVEILTGFNELDEAVSIVESRNTSTQVKEQSLEELRQHYEVIKKVLIDQTYSGKIAYKEHELLEDGSAKNIDIKEILSYLVCFDVESFSGKKHPIKAYTSKAAVIKHFKENRERMKKYIPLLPQILALRDTIYRDLPGAYNGTGGKFGGLKGVMELKSKSKARIEQLPYIDEESNYRIPNGFIYPLLAAFRNIIDCSKDKCSWKTDPIKLFKELQEDLATRIGSQAIEFRNPNKLGKDNATWVICYDLVELETFKRNI